jgi:NAD(P)-dependent dehydrogenase (short-subunit alcohol dehydrogenase family)
VWSDATDTEIIITTPEYFERYYGPRSAVEEEQPAPIEVRHGMTSGEVPLPEQGSTVVQRQVLRLRAIPLPRIGELSLSGTACIFGDNADARALAAALTARGMPVQLIAIKDDLDEVLARIENLWNKSLPRHLFLLTARDPEALCLDSRDSVVRRRNIGVLAPYLVVQRWLRRLAKESLDAPPTLTAVTNLGGDFAIQSTAIAPEGGALAGLLKSVHVEAARRHSNRLRCRVIDFPSTESPQQVAAATIDELVADQRDIEVSWRRGERSVVEVATSPLKVQRSQIERGGVWVVTGGARGITAACALYLGQKYGLKLHLVGASPVPDSASPWLSADEEQLKQIKQEIVRQAVSQGRSPEEEWLRVKKAREINTSLQQFQAAGVEATYHSCDISDWDSVAKLLAEIRRQDGRIRGIIHGAGYAKSARIEMKSRAVLDRTVRPKFDGALALMLQTVDDPLQHFILFGSLSGRFGGNGLSDYAAANDALAKLSAWYRGVRAEVGTACIAWQTWDEIGMAMLSDSAGINRNALQMQFIPPQEGVEHLEREILAGEPDAEIVATDGFFERHFYRPEQLSTASGNAATEESTRPVAPLIESLIADSTPDSYIATIEFDPVGDPFLIDHRLRKSPFLPGVVALESLAQAVQLANPAQRVVALRNVEIVQGIKFQADRRVAARVTVTGSGGLRHAALSVEVRDRRNRLVESARPCASGTVELGAQNAKIEAAVPPPPTAGWFEFLYSDDALLYHGPRFRYLKQGNYFSDGGWGRIVAPPPSELAGARPATGWILPLAALDACVVACGSFIFLSYGGRLEVPSRFDELRLGRVPSAGEQCLLRFSMRSRHDRHSVFDFTLFGQAGELLLDVRGYTTVLVGEQSANVSRSRSCLS